MKKKTVRFLLLILALSALTGCGSKYTQLNKILIIREIGIDRTASGYKLSVAVFDAEAKDDSKSGKTDMSVFHAEGSSVFEAIKDLSRQTGKEPYCAHNKAVIISEDAAKDGIADILDFFVRYNECRLDVNMFLTEGTAEETIENTVETQLIEEAADASLIGANNGRYPQSTMLEVSKALLTNGTDPFMPYLKKSGQDDYRLAGTALFADGRFAGVLDEEETKGLLLLTGRTKGAVIRAEGSPDFLDGWTAVFELDNTSVNIKTADLGIEIDTSISAKVYEFTGHDGKQADAEILGKMLESSAGEYMRRAIEKSLQYGSDPVGFGRRMERAVPGSGENTDIAQYNISVGVKITSLGQKL